MNGISLVEPGKYSVSVNPAVLNAGFYCAL